jgi:fermentation-respiration switch protein FrsA (DUF1100 family)
MTYFPMQSPTNDAPSDSQDVAIQTPDGERLSAWWFEAPGAKLATLYLHGNGGYLSMYIDHLRAINQAGNSVLIIDYRGYGRSTGAPSETGLYTDAQAAYQWLRSRGFAPNQIVIQGLSLGSAVAVEVATRNRVGGVILEAPLSSARAVAASKLPFLGWTLPLGFDSIAKIPALKAPLLVIHGDRDRVIDLTLGRDLYAAAPEPKEFFLVPGAGHEDLPMVAGTRYQAALQRLYQRCSR